MVTSREVFTALGSNKGNRMAHIEAALDALRASGAFELVRTSTWWETAPVGPVAQGDFINGAAATRSTWEPDEILELLLDIETRLGRKRSVRYGPRIIDLDLLMVGDLIVSTDQLTLPHPAMAERRFVLGPLAEVAPNAVHPGEGLTIDGLLARLP